MENRSLITSQLRRRVLLHSGGEDLILYEGKIAKEFGVSRTPIRQVIQSLAAESLVEVRSGVGTIAAPMLAERRDKDLVAYSAILDACASCTSATHFPRVKIELATLRMHLEAGNAMSANDVFFDVATKYIGALGDLVDDKILKASLVACFWRFTRRRIVEHRSDIETVIKELLKTIKDAEYGAETGDPQHILRMASTNVEVMLKAPARA